MTEKEIERKGCRVEKREMAIERIEREREGHRDNEGKERDIKKEGQRDWQ